MTGIWRGLLGFDEASINLAACLIAPERMLM
jgi:hypothetical protein